MKTSSRSKNVAGVSGKKQPKSSNNQGSQMSAGQTDGKPGGSGNGLQGSNMDGHGNAQLTGTP